LANWRYQDRKAGRSGAAPGFPEYRLFGGCVRYRVVEDQDVIAAFREMVSQQITGPGPITSIASNVR
jgi:hypothetical protein